jgi:hypothetical protein
MKEQERDDVTKEAQLYSNRFSLSLILDEKEKLVINEGCEGDRFAGGEILIQRHRQQRENNDKKQTNGSMEEA